MSVKSSIKSCLFQQAFQIVIFKISKGTFFKKKKKTSKSLQKHLTSSCLGPKPGPPRNLTVTEISNGFLITWQVPLERSHLIQYYTIKYRTDGNWKTLNKGQIRPEETSYLGNETFNDKQTNMIVFSQSNDWMGTTCAYYHTIEWKLFV